jgi:predicted metalloprotease
LAHRLGDPGDFELQRAGRGRVVPESFMHSSTEPRMTFFRRGFDGGRIGGCNTFDCH